jgi:hypothetical protein
VKTAFPIETEDQVFVLRVALKSFATQGPDFRWRGKNDGRSTDPARCRKLLSRLDSSLEIDHRDARVLEGALDAFIRQGAFQRTSLILSAINRGREPDDLRAVKSSDKALAKEMMGRLQALGLYVPS